MSSQRDLALQRTRLANERTLLAYIRTFMGFLGLGVALVAVFESSVAAALGIASMGAGALVMIIGMISYVRNRAAMAADSRDADGRAGPA